MKILVISAAFPPLRAGEADHTMHLCRRLAERGLDIDVLTTTKDAVSSNFPFKLHPIMRHWSWSALPRLTGFLKSCSPDAVLLIYSDRDYDRHPMITFASSISKALFPAVPFVTQLETEYISRQTSIVSRAALKTIAWLAGPRRIDYVFGTLLLRSDRIIVLSERHQAGLSKTFGNLNNKVSVVPPPPLLRICPENNGTSRYRSRQALGVTPDDFLIAYYGYLYPDKGIETLFEAFQIVNVQRSNTRLVMVGGHSGENHGLSYLKRLHDFTKRLGIDRKIIWTGEYASDSDDASFYLRGADACVFPFRYGVTLNRSSLAAAAAHGLPIVTTRGDFLESPFLDQENILLCSPDEPNSLALAIASLIDDGILRERLRAGALKLAAEYFSWDKAVERTLVALRPCQAAV